MTMKSFIFAIIPLMIGCAEPYTVFHTQTGDPIILGRRAYSEEGCLTAIREEAARLGVSLSTVHMRGSWQGLSLLWPFEPGYACEGAIGPEQLPHGSYSNIPPLTPQG